MIKQVKFKRVLTITASGRSSQPDGETETFMEGLFISVLTGVIDIFNFRYKNMNITISEVGRLEEE